MLLMSPFHEKICDNQNFGQGWLLIRIMGVTQSGAAVAAISQIGTTAACHKAKQSNCCEADVNQIAVCTLLVHQVH
jgi:hypothetical protein